MPVVAVAPIPDEVALAEVEVVGAVRSILGVAEYLSDCHGLPSKIKWPNDIYVGDSKICGILIENSLHGDSISACIIGIGQNVNQKDFPAEIPNPTSMSLLTGQTYNIEEELSKLLQHIDRRIGKVFGAKARFRLNTAYLHRLYRWNEPHDYLIMHPSQCGDSSVRTRDNFQCPLDDTPQRFTGAIRGVTSGRRASSHRRPRKKYLAEIPTTTVAVKRNFTTFVEICCRYKPTYSNPHD